MIRWQGQAIPVGAACALAAEEQRRGNTPGALDIYTRVVQQIPSFPEGHNNRGVLLQTLERFSEALASYDNALALRANYANAHFNRGTVLKKLGRRDEALASYDRTIALNSSHAEAHNNRGVILQELKQYPEALAAYERVIALNPNHAEAHNNRGIVLASLGRMAEAETMFRRAAALKPTFPDPLFNLANIRSHGEANHDELQKIRDLLNQPGLPLDQQDHLHFSLGKIYDDCGLYDEAFAEFQKANELRNRQVAYNPALISATTGKLIQVFDTGVLSHPHPSASDDPSPIFVVGMPRSGTTLLASILSNHPAVASAGELPTLADLIAELPKLIPGQPPYPDLMPLLPAAAARELTAAYLKRLRRDADDSIRYVVDKNPLNFRHLGLIHLLFPRAHIFHCTRDPMAICLSNYFQRFPLQMDFCFDLQNIGHFYREYSRLMAHWRAIPGLKLIDVPYEELVVSTEDIARALLQSLELDWDPRCLAPHTNRFAVETASQWQVRQPIYRDALDNWRHYEGFLGSLKAALAGN